MKRLLTVAAGVLVSVCAPAVVRGEPPVPAAVAPGAPSAKESRVERWYVLMMQGQRAGYLQSVETAQGDRITTTSDMHMELKRGPINMTVLMQSSFVETLDGKPVSMKMVQQLGGMATTTETTFTPDGIETVSTVGSQKTTKKSPLPREAWMTPGAAERYVKAELAKGSREMTVTTIDPTVGEGLLKVTRRVVGEENVQVFGKTVPAVKWEVVVDKFKTIKQAEYVSAAGETLRSVTDMGGIKLEQLAADKELALSKLDAPELLESTTVRPSRELKDPRHLAHATYRLSVDKGELPDLPGAAGQTFSRESGRTAVVQQEAAAVEPVAAEQLEAVKAKHLEASPTIKGDDEAVVALVKRAKVDGLSDASAAEKLRRFVHSFITQKNMNVGFATASEVARSREGDCTEHAVLLAAVLRAAGIPSRCCSGLVYVDRFAGQEGIFGYHMWTQALLRQADGSWAWKNLDATLRDETPYDAAHILLSVSALGEGEMQNFLVTTAPLIGRLKIEVVEAK
ncbi:MAG: transglutaminase-like domain-containing protein [Phycisphaerales bacterium]|nr:transglutaminase-like domain-containing protein [Phycisphaerales bacterium]